MGILPTSTRSGHNFARLFARSCQIFGASLELLSSQPATPILITRGSRLRSAPDSLASYTARFCSQKRLQFGFDWPKPSRPRLLGLRLSSGIGKEVGCSKLERYCGS
jgi:hypothetical protein